MLWERYRVPRWKWILGWFYWEYIEHCAFSEVIVLGETNFDINDANAGHSLLKTLLLNYNIVCCDDLINGPIQCTYDNTALGQSSLIYHFCGTLYVRACTSHVLIIDSGDNTSDHIPVVLCLQLPPAASPIGSNAINKPVSLKVRWDKDNMSEYYRMSGEAFALKLGCSCSSCDVGCISHNHSQSSNDYYSNIVSALKGAEKLSISSISHSALRNFWNNELDELKSKSVFFWHGVA